MKIISEQESQKIPKKSSPRGQTLHPVLSKTKSMEVGQILSVEPEEYKMKSPLRILLHALGQRYNPHRKFTVYTTTKDGYIITRIQ